MRDFNKVKLSTILLLLAILIVAFTVSCSGDAAVNASVKGEKTLRISSYATLGSSAKNVVSKGASVKDLDFKDEIKNASSSDKVATPVAFTLNLNETMIYVPKDNANIQAGASDSFSIVPTGEYSNSRNLNILCSSSLDSGYIQSENKVYEGVYFMFLPHIGDSNKTGHPDGVRLISAICVKLPEGINKDKIKNKFGSQDKLPNFGEDYVWFEYASLIPYKISDAAFLSYLCFQTGIESATLVGAEDHQNESYTYGPITTRGNACALSIPLKEALDFSKYKNPEISLNYNVQDLVQFFEQSNGDIYAYFNKENPFPISLSLGEFSENPVLSINTTPDEASYPFNCYKIRRNNCMLLQYTKPTNPSYQKVQIFKSESGIDLDYAQELMTEYDASGTLDEQLKLLYEGNADYYQEMMTNSESCTASYFIRSLTKTGKSSVVEFRFWD